MKLGDRIGGLMVKHEIWKVKREVFRSTAPETVELRNKLFPDGEPTTDEFVIGLARYIKRQKEKEEQG